MSFIDDLVVNRSDRKQYLVAGDVNKLHQATAWMMAGLQRSLFPDLEGCWRAAPCRPSCFESLSLACEPLLYTLE
jgi:hypothetical protein